MATYLDTVSGLLTKLSAIAASLGAGDADKLIATNASGELDPSFLPSGVGAETFNGGVASESLSAGNLVQVFDNGGSPGVRSADATAVGKAATGFVLTAVAPSAPATVYLPGQLITGLSGLSIGSKYWLDTTAGAFTLTPPAATGNIQQPVGYAQDATTLLFEPDRIVVIG